MKQLPKPEVETGPENPELSVPGIPQLEAEYADIPF
jgi:hypothetical protein